MLLEIRLLQQQIEIGLIKALQISQLYSIVSEPFWLIWWHLRRKISLPNDASIFEELLRCWLAPPLEFHFVYATQKARLHAALQVHFYRDN